MSSRRNTAPLPWGDVRGLAMVELGLMALAAVFAAIILVTGSA
jgi:hypothetical protein